LTDSNEENCENCGYEIDLDEGEKELDLWEYED
jgi:hypothetical protein